MADIIPVTSMIKPPEYYAQDWGPDYGQVYNQVRAQDLQRQMQEAQSGRNALQSIMSGPNVDPGTGLPNPRGIAQLIGQAPSAGISLAEITSKINSQRQADSLRQLQTNQLWSQNIDQNVAAPALKYYQDQLQIPGTSNEQAVTNTNKYINDKLRPDWIKSQSPPPDIVNRFVQPFDPNQWLMRSEITQKRQEAIAKSEKQLYDVIGLDGKVISQVRDSPLEGQGVYRSAADRKIIDLPAGATLRPVAGRESAINSRPLPPPMQAELIPTEPGGKSQTINVRQFNGPDNSIITKDEAGNVVDSAKIVPGSIQASTRTAGGRAQQQVLSIMGASNEILPDLANAMELPITATSGWFMGTYADKPSELRKALERSVVSGLTTDQTKDLNTTFQGIQRSLAIVEGQGRATGLVGLTNMSSALVPQQGDNGYQILRKYAQIRQIVDQEIENIKAAPGVTDEQKKLLDQQKSKLAEAVPFAVRDVNALERNKTDQSVRDFANKVMDKSKESESKGPSVKSAGSAPPIARLETSAGAPTAADFAQHGPRLQFDGKGPVWVRDPNGYIHVEGAP
jgi:hypothetical protein